MKTIPVTATSRACALATAMMDAARQGDTLHLVADGGLALAQMHKALGLVQEWLAPECLDLQLLPAGDTILTTQQEAASAWVFSAVPGERPAEEGLAQEVGAGT